MTDIIAIENKKLIVSSKDSVFKETLRDSKVKVGDVVKADSGDLDIVAKFDGKDINEFYEVRLQSEPYPVMYRKSVKQLSAQFGTDPSLGGVLMRKKGTNVFHFVPNDVSKDKIKVEAVVK